MKKSSLAKMGGKSFCARVRHKRLEGQQEIAPNKKRDHFS